MSAISFFSDDARTRTTSTIESVESHTAAEVVIAVRRSSGDYRHADYLFGFGVAVAALCVLLFAPQAFNIAHFPIDVVVAFALGTVISSNLPAIRRALSGRGRMHSAVLRAARAAFYDLGISGTTGRTGVLVYFSAFERRAEVVPDSGVDADAMGDAYSAVVAKISDAAERTDLDGFLAAVDSLGPVLGAALPRAEDDVNELPDTMDIE